MPRAPRIKPLTDEMLRRMLLDMMWRASRYRRATDQKQYLKADLDYLHDTAQEALERLEVRVAEDG